MLFLGLMILGAPTQAEDLRLESRSSDARVEHIALPPLVGALSIDVSLLGPFAISDSLEQVEELGGDVSLGWRHFLTPHGELSLRTYGVGGLRPGADFFSLGVGTALMVRGFDPRFIFGGVALLGEARWGSWSGAESRTGWQALVGLEATFGRLIGGSWLAFGETGTSVSMAYVDLGGPVGWEVIARWLIRFDFAYRSGELHEPVESKATDLQK